MDAFKDIEVPQMLEVLRFGGPKVDGPMIEPWN